MPGFLGGSSGSSSSASGEIRFPAEFIDPVTKLRVSEPQTLMDTDFEYGLQPTKWETVELINNTPSFFSASGDTTIPNLLDMTTTAGSREIKVTTALAHGLAIGIPINVTGTKSLTADGSYIINSIPDSTTFTYLCKQNQLTTASIVDLYSSIITGQFFQGSQVKISDSDGIVTNAAGVSTLTVKTDAPHGFGVNTPFYFLNLNSTVSQEFDSSNTAARTFDASNTATAQTFDGSNTLTSYPIDLGNEAITSGATSSIATVNITDDTITVTHGAENFIGRPIGTPLYYNVAAASGYFATTPRGIVFLKRLDTATSASSTFQVSATPDGAAIDLVVSMTGTFQVASAASLFPGNNIELSNPFQIQVYENSGLSFDGANNQGKIATVNSYSGTSILITNNEGSTVPLGWNVGQMMLYSTTGTAATGLTNNTTYFITSIVVLAPSAPGLIQIQVATAPGGTSITVSGGTGTQTFKTIGVSTDRDMLYVPAHGLQLGDLVKYTYPTGGAFTTSGAPRNYYYVEKVVDTNIIQLGTNKGAGGLTQIATNTWEWTTGPVTDVSEIFTQAPSAFAQLPATGVFYLKYPINIVGGTQTITVACRKDTTNNRVSQSAFTMRGQNWAWQTGISTIYNYSNDDHDSLVMLADGTGVLQHTNSNSWTGGNWDRFRATSNLAENVGINSVMPGSPSDVSANATIAPFPKTGINVYIDLGNSRLRCHNRSYVSYNSDLSTYIGTGQPVNSLMVLTDGVNGFVIYRWGTSRAVEIRMNLATGAIFSSRNFAFSGSQTNGTEEDTFGSILFAVDGGFTYYSNTTWFEDRSPWSARTSLTNTNSWATGGLNTQTDMDLFGSIDSGDRQVWFADWGHDDGGLFQVGNDNLLGVRKTNIYFLPDNYTA